jgi:hypothetical protein
MIIAVQEQVGKLDQRSSAKIKLFKILSGLYL